MSDPTPPAPDSASPAAYGPSGLPVAKSEPPRKRRGCRCCCGGCLTLGGALLALLAVWILRPARPPDVYLTDVAHQSGLHVLWEIRQPAPVLTAMLRQGRALRDGPGGAALPEPLRQRLEAMEEEEFAAMEPFLPWIAGRVGAMAVLKDPKGAWDGGALMTLSPAAQAIVACILPHTPEVVVDGVTMHEVEGVHLKLVAGRSYHLLLHPEAEDLARAWQALRAPAPASTPASGAARPGIGHDLGLPATARMGPMILLGPAAFAADRDLPPTWVAWRPTKDEAGRGGEAGLGGEVRTAILLDPAAWGLPDRLGAGGPSASAEPMPEAVPLAGAGPFAAPTSLHGWIDPHPAWRALGRRLFGPAGRPIRGASHPAFWFLWRLGEAGILPHADGRVALAISDAPVRERDGVPGPPRLTLAWGMPAEATEAGREAFHAEMEELVDYTRAPGGAPLVQAVRAETRLLPPDRRSAPRTLHLAPLVTGHVAPSWTHAADWMLLSSAPWPAGEATPLPFTSSAWPAPRSAPRPSSPPIGRASPVDAPSPTVARRSFAELRGRIDMDAETVGALRAYALDKGIGHGLAMTAADREALRTGVDLLTALMRAARVPDLRCTLTLEPADPSAPVLPSALKTAEAGTGPEDPPDREPGGMSREDPGGGVEESPADRGADGMGRGADRGAHGGAHGEAHGGAHGEGRAMARAQTGEAGARAVLRLRVLYELRSPDGPSQEP